MSRWQDQFESITTCIPVDANDVTPEDHYQPCNCKDQRYSDDEDEICVDQRCVNFATCYECKLGKCSSKCRNNRFQTGQMADIEVIEFPLKGFGLIAKKDIKANVFLGEYLGELVSEEELKRRYADTNISGD